MTTETTGVTKKWYLSRVVWFNVLSLIGMVVQGIIDKEVMPEYMQYELMAVAVVNLILRFISTQPLTPPNTPVPPVTPTTPTP